MLIEGETGYVLEARPYRESSLLLELLTAEHGRLAVVARGVRGERPAQRHQRALLEPFRRLRLALTGRGEVLTLQRVDDVDSNILRPSGTFLLSAFYVNELVRKLIPRQDPVTGVFALYQTWLSRLAQCLPTSKPEVLPTHAGGDLSGLAWALRRFERDLLGQLGYGLALDHDSDTGEPVDPDAVYMLDPEQGARSWRDGSPWRPVSGTVLLAWAGESRPETETAGELRRLARGVIRHHLGGGEMEVWRLAARWQ